MRRVWCWWVRGCLASFFTAWAGLRPIHHHHRFVATAATCAAVPARSLLKLGGVAGSQFPQMPSSACPAHPLNHRSSSDDATTDRSRGQPAAPNAPSPAALMEVALHSPDAAAERLRRRSTLWRERGWTRRRRPHRQASDSHRVASAVVARRRRRRRPAAAGGGRRAPQNLKSLGFLLPPAAPPARSSLRLRRATSSSFESPRSPGAPAFASSCAS